MPAQTIIKVRRDTAANWASVNPVLASGEQGYETDTGLSKYGNGTSAWNALSYSATSATTYRVMNDTAATILKGTLVSAVGAEATGRIDVAPFEVTGLQDSEIRVMGLAMDNIAAGAIGDVISFGRLKDLDTRGSVASAIAVGDETWSVGDILFAHPTVPGKLTNVRPKHDLAVAFLTLSSATAGQIAVRILPGNFHLEWLHDVELDAPASGQVLQYDGTDWVNATIDALPDQTGESGNYLTTDGTNASWGTLDIPPGTVVSDTAPASPDEGQLWWDSTDGTLYIYYDNFWVEAVTGVTGPAGPAGPALTANDVARISGWLDGTIEPRPRGQATSFYGTTSGRVNVSWFTPAADLTVSNVSFGTVTTPDGGVTFARMGLYQTDDDGQSATLLARTANDTTLFTTTNTIFTRSFDTEGGYPATVTLTAGVRYGLAHIVVCTNLGTKVGYANIRGGLNRGPAAGAVINSQTDFPETFSSPITPSGTMWARAGQ